MNYIRHLNAVMEKFIEDDRLNPSHVSLYLGLFQLWNLSRFHNPISISRNEMMKISKIGSGNTYIKCLKELTAFGYIDYRPSHNPLKGSTVYMLKFDTSNEQVKGHNLPKSDTSYKQALRPSINSTNIHKNDKESETFFQPPTLEIIINFFKKSIAAESELDAELESKKFFNHYTSNGWKVGSNKMEDWCAAAENWIIKTNQFHGSTQSKEYGSGNLHTKHDKDYGEPL